MLEVIETGVEESVLFSADATGVVGVSVGGWFPLTAIKIKDHFDGIGVRPQILDMRSTPTLDKLFLIY